jgi:hypothetical protein
MFGGFSFQFFLLSFLLQLVSGLIGHPCDLHWNHRTTSSTPNNRPIFGVLAQDTSTDSGFNESLGRYYIPASYVKWIESGGGRVVPIAYDMDIEELLGILCSVNGILLPGGDYNLVGSRYESRFTISVLHSFLPLLTSQIEPNSSIISLSK